MTNPIDKDTITPDTILPETERISLAGHPGWVDAHHTAVHESIAAALDVLQRAYATGTNPAAGAALANYDARIRQMEQEIVVLQGTPVPGPPGQPGAPGQRGPTGPGITVTTALFAPPNPSTGDIWIDDRSQRPYMWSGGAWNPMSGNAGPQGRPGTDGKGVKTVNIQMLPSNALPIAIYDPVSERLDLRIPIGKQGPPAQYQGTVATMANLPAPTPGTIGHIWGVTANQGWYWCDGNSWRLISHWLQGPQGIQGPPGPRSTLDQPVAATGLPGSQVQVTLRQTGANSYRYDFTIPAGEKGDKGDAGETFNPQGVVADVLQLPANPPKLTVLATNTPTTWLWVYDPASPAASAGPASVGPPMVAPAGWVSLGEITGPPGPRGPVGPPAHPVVFESFPTEADMQAYVTAGAANVPADHAGFFMVQDTAEVWGYVRGRPAELVQLGSLLSPQSLPTGGAQNQVLVKNSATDFDFGWQDPGTLPAGNADGDIAIWDDTNQVWYVDQPPKGIPDGQQAKDEIRWDAANSRWEVVRNEPLPEGVEVNDSMLWDGNRWMLTKTPSPWFGSGTPAMNRAPVESDLWLVTAGAVSALPPQHPLPVTATGITVGAPGVFTPPNARVPFALANLQALGDLGQTAAWATTDFVVLGDGMSVTWDGAAFVQWTNPTPPPVLPTTSRDLGRTAGLNVDPTILLTPVADDLPAAMRVSTTGANNWRFQFAPVLNPGRVAAVNFEWHTVAGTVTASGSLNWAAIAADPTNPARYVSSSALVTGFGSGGRVVLKFTYTDGSQAEVFIEAQ